MNFPKTQTMEDVEKFFTTEGLSPNSFTVPPWTIELDKSKANTSHEVVLTPNPNANLVNCGILSCAALTVCCGCVGGVVGQPLREKQKKDYMELVDHWIKVDPSTTANENQAKAELAQQGLADIDSWGYADDADFTHEGIHYQWRGNQQDFIVRLSNGQELHFEKARKTNSSAVAWSAPGYCVRIQFPTSALNTTVPFISVENVVVDTKQQYDKTTGQFRNDHTVNTTRFGCADFVGKVTNWELTNFTLAAEHIKMPMGEDALLGVVQSSARPPPLVYFLALVLRSKFPTVWK